MVEEGLQGEPKELKFSSPADLAFYVQRVSGSATFAAKNVGFRSKDLLDSHFNKACLLVDKYFSCVDPSGQLQVLFDSMGVMEYDSFFEYGSAFYNFICTHEDGHVSEVFRPRVKGGHYNPYVRYLSSRACGSQQCSKLMLLAGVQVADDKHMPGFSDDPLDIVTPVFHNWVLTFPSDIDMLLLDEGRRDDVIKRMWRCYHHFFKVLRRSRKNSLGLFRLDDDQVLGSSASLHLWSSSVPVLPNAHFHMIMPHFSYAYVNRYWRGCLDDMNAHIYDAISECIVEVTPDQNSFRGRGEDVSAEGVAIASPDHVFKPVRVLQDKIRYEGLVADLSRELMHELHFSMLGWRDASVPVDHAVVKELWSSCVFDEFKDLLYQQVLCDVHLEFIRYDERERLLHALQYKTRPPVLDLDLFLKKVDGVILDHNCLCKEAVLGCLREQLCEAVRLDHVADIRRFESLLAKAESVFHLYSDLEVYRWLQFLAMWVTDTRVFGFWVYLQRYMLDPLDRRVLVYDEVCPVCGGSLMHVRHVDSICVDSVIIRGSSGFIVVNLLDRPPP